MQIIFEFCRFFGCSSCKVSLLKFCIFFFLFYTCVVLLISLTYWFVDYCGCLSSENRSIQLFLVTQYSRQIFWAWSSDSSMSTWELGQCLGRNARDGQRRRILPELDLNYPPTDGNIATNSQEYPFDGHSDSRGEIGDCVEVIDDDLAIINQRIFAEVWYLVFIDFFFFWLGPQMLFRFCLIHFYVF